MGVDFVKKEDWEEWSNKLGAEIKKWLKKESVKKFMQRNSAFRVN